MRVETEQRYEKLAAALKADLGSVDLDLATFDGELSSVIKFQMSKSFFKKLLPRGFDPECDRRALEKFLRINDRIRTLGSIPKSRYFFRFQGILDLLLGGIDPSLLSPQGLSERFDIGPGSSRKVDSRSLFHKLRGPLSYSTEALLQHYKAAVTTTGTLAAQVQLESCRGFVATPASRLFFVPKDSAISRTCCTEPLVNMFYQKAIGEVLEGLLRQIGISLSDQQQKNQAFAAHGSLHSTFGTIDLVSASDSMAWEQLIVRCFRSNKQLLGLLRLARCEQTVLPDGSLLPLGMISSMGNGFTFPLQTLIFACAVMAVYEEMGIPLKGSLPFSSLNFGVFGDDIVVVAKAYDEVVTFLGHLGFEVNVGKSFNTGHFRESCGADWYRGRNVRGLYVRSLEASHDTYSAYNRAVRWQVERKTPIWSTVEELRSLTGDFIVPFHEDDAAGRKVSYAEACSRTKRTGLFRQIAYRRLVFEPKSQGIEQMDPSGASPLIGACRLYGAIRFPAVPVGTSPGSGRLTLSPRVVPGSWRKRVATTPWWDYAPGRPAAWFREWKLTVDLLGSMS